MQDSLKSPFKVWNECVYGFALLYTSGWGTDDMYCVPGLLLILCSWLAKRVRMTFITSKRHAFLQTLNGAHKEAWFDLSFRSFYKRFFVNPCWLTTILRTTCNCWILLKSLENRADNSVCRHGYLYNCILYTRRSLLTQNVVIDIALLSWFLHIHICFRIYLGYYFSHLSATLRWLSIERRRATELQHQISFEVLMPSLKNLAFL